MGRQLRMALAVGLSLWLLTGSTVLAAVGESAPLHREYRQGEATLIQELSATRLRLADRLTWRLQLVSPEAWQVVFPELGADLAGLRLVEQHDEPARLLKDRQVERVRVLLLEPLMSGELSLPGLSVQAGPAGGAMTAITSEPIPLTVVSLLDKGGATDIDDIQPMLVPAASPWRLVGSGLAGVMLLGLAGYWLWRRRQAPAPQPSLDQLALARLDELARALPASEAEVQRFHVELSGLLRHYIEARFGLRAPERTSEEFLREAAVGRLLGPNQCQRLEGFLAHCDRVKFARYQPDRGEMERAGELCRSFIIASRLPEEKP